MADIAISVKNVSKDFKLPHERVDSVKSLFTHPLRRGGSTMQHALKDISFDIKKGEFFGIVGRNGSGKSTLLKIIAGIYQPTKGSVRVNGRLVPFIELGVGFNPELSGRENVYLNGALMGFSQKEIKAKYESIVEFAELEQFMDQKLKNYSSGMQVRLAFSVATILAESDILLIDEVLAVGDADFQRKCFAYFKQLKKAKKTVIFVTHDMDAVREYCDRAVLIQKSKVVKMGTANEIANEYQSLFNKVLNQSSSKVQTAQTGKRWGNGLVVFDKAYVTRLEDELEFNAVLSAGDQDIDDVVLGFRFVDTDGKIVAGASTLNVKDGKPLSFKANESKHLTFTMPNILGSGVYNVGATVRLTDKVTVCDYWDDITTIFNNREESYYPIVLPALLKIE